MAYDGPVTADEWRAEYNEAMRMLASVGEEEHKARTELANLQAAVRALRPDCGDHSCKFATTKKGMRTNGGCRCVDIVPSDKRRAAEAALRRALESGET